MKRTYEDMKEIIVVKPDGFATASAYAPFHPTAAPYVTHTRKKWVIKRQIDRLYKKWMNHLQDGLNPTHWIMNEIDFEFIKAYCRYQQYLQFSPMDKNELFGLKIVLHKGVTTLGWEP